MDRAEYRGIALKCKEVMADPKENLDKIRDVLGMVEYGSSDGKMKGMVYLSLLKVFRAIIPSFKIRSLKDVVKDKRDSLHMKEYDRNMLALYTSYVKLVTNDASDESYISACEILEHLDHFNCTDKIVLKVLEGSTRKRMIATLCCDTIRSKLRNDISGELVSMILNQMLDSEYNPLLLEYLVDVPVIDKLLKDEEERAREYRLANLHAPKKEKNSLFHKKTLNNRKLKKIEKERIISQELAKSEEEMENNKEELINRKGIYDAIQRVYFTVLSGSDYDRYKYTFIGLMKYKEIIRAGFMEGLYFLLNDKIMELCSSAQIQGVLCILTLYGEKGYDFKRLVSVLYSILYPMNFDLTECDYVDLIRAVKSLFVKRRQPVHRTHVLLNRLIVHGCSRFVPSLRVLIAELSATYDIEFSDLDNIKHREFDQNSLDVDLLPSNPFFDHCLYKRML